MQITCFYCRGPCWLGGESCHCMVVADKLVDVCNSLGGGRLKELRWQAVAKNCLGTIVLHVFYEWNAPQLCLVAAPASEDGGSSNCDFCIVCIVNVHLLLVKNCNIICVNKIGYTDL